MGRNCERLCPLARDCAILDILLRQDEERLIDESSQYMSILNGLQDEEEAVALNIQNGMMTVEESEERTARLDTEYRMTFGQTASEAINQHAVQVAEDLATNWGAAEAVASAAGTITLAAANCQGPKLNWFTRLKETWDFAKVRRDARHAIDLPLAKIGLKKVLADRRADNLQRHGHCANAAARAAFGLMLGNPKVAERYQQHKHFVKDFETKYPHNA